MDLPACRQVELSMNGFALKYVSIIRAIGIIGLIHLLNPYGAGTYNLGANGNIGDAGRWTEGTDSWTADNTIGSGSIVISELTATDIKGTFEFTGNNGSTDEVIQF